MEIETNKISEIYKGHYQVILDFPEKGDLLKILDSNYEYVWILDYLENTYEWKNFEVPVYNQLNSLHLARNIKMELLVKTEEFIKFIPHITQTLKIIQTNIIPPYYLDLNIFSKKSKYDLLLEKVDYLFELEMPGAIDYSPIISPNIKFLEKVIENFKNGRR